MTFDGFGSPNPAASWDLYIFRFLSDFFPSMARDPPAPPKARRTHKANKDIKMMDSAHLIPKRDRVIFQRRCGGWDTATTLNVNSIIDLPRVWYFRHVALPLASPAPPHSTFSGTSREIRLLANSLYLTWFIIPATKNDSYTYNTTEAKKKCKCTVGRRGKYVSTLRDKLHYLPQDNEQLLYAIGTS